MHQAGETEVDWRGSDHTDRKTLAVAQAGTVAARSVAAVCSKRAGWGSFPWARGTSWGRGTALGRRLDTNGIGSPGIDFGVGLGVGGETTMVIPVPASGSSRSAGEEPQQEAIPIPRVDTALDSIVLAASLKVAPVKRDH